MKKILFITAIILSGCGANNSAINAKKNSTGESAAWLQNVRSYSPEFKAPNANAEEIWGRAQVFISKYSSMKIQTVSNYVIETYNTPQRSANAKVYGGAADFAYTVTRSPGKDSTSFTIECRSNNNVYDDVKQCVIDNNHIMSYYMQTGESIKYPEFIAQ